MFAGTTYPFYFWADNRPNGGGFAFHSLASIPSDSESPLFRISRADSSDWNVLIRDNFNSYTGVSTSNNITIANIELGNELHNNFQTANEPQIFYTNNRWLDSNGNFEYQGNDGVGTTIISPVQAGWFNGEDPPHNTTGGVWFSCIPGFGC